ncbi:MAG: L-idonate 5-dehydrogenase [Proteobacteria bacterium]|nr:L-idonate 5-dehydrogenase [Pseudomonadota bacterium]
MRAAVLTAKQSIETMSRDEPALGPTGVRVRIRAGGICGSDLHYFHHYRMGDFPVREPFVLGHEAAGEVVEIGADVTRVKLGDMVTVNPSHPCGTCEFCLAGRALLCDTMVFLGSSRRFPHVQGMFAETYRTDERQCFVVPGDLSINAAAFAEPLSVALHATGKAGPLLGAKVLISGSGPIGSLVLLTAKLAGAASVTMTDVLDAPLKVVEDIGADRVVNVRNGDQGLADPARARGSFDVAFDASGHPGAVLSAIRYLRPGGVFVQIGTFADPMVPIPTDQIMVKELVLKSSFRFDKEFAWAVRYLCERRIDVAPLLSHKFSMDDANEAFRMASDRSQSMKVHLIF